MADLVYRKRLIEYLPPFMQRFLEMKEIIGTEDIELDTVNECIGKILDDAFIKDCSESGIKRYEGMLKIAPNITDSLEVRKLRVAAQWNNSIPYTYRTLIQKLNALYGIGNYEVSGDLQRYNICVTAHSELSGQKNILSSMLDNILPLNMAFLAKNEVLRNFIICIPEKMDAPMMEMKTFFFFWGCDILDGTRLLDGSVLMNAKKRYNLIPRIKCSGIKFLSSDIVYTPAVSTKAALPFHNGRQDIRTGVAYLYRLSFQEHADKAKTAYRAEITTYEGIGEVSVTYKRNLCYLDGSVLLDGSKLLNALYEKEEI